jgi:hypothetical protein
MAVRLVKMAKWRNRTCECGKIDFTASTSPICLECFTKKRKQKKVAEEQEAVLACYGNVEGPTLNAHNQRCYTFTHSCGTTQTWAFFNLIKQWKTRACPCKTCGGKERMAVAMNGYVAKFGLDERARTNLRDYTKKVRGLSEKTYRDNIDLINPERHPRMLGNRGWHLDHIIPIVECFKRGWSPEEAAKVENLQLLSALENMTKGRKV